MRWARTLQTVDVHCGGEIGRVVMSGVLDVPGATMADKLHHINTVDDSLRRMLTLEPRGGPAGGVVLLLPATRPEADVGLIVLLADQAHAMSGSNAMCAATALLETGTIPMTEPEAKIVFDTAAGLVTATATCRNGEIESIRMAMPASFVHQPAVQLDVGPWGQLAVDVCFGGVFYGVVDVSQIGLEITPRNARALAETGVVLRDRIDDALTIQHPEIPQLTGLSYVMFTAGESDGAIRTCTTLRPGRVDRSACGTGSAALVALRVAQGHLAQGDRLITRSIIGSEFQNDVLAVEEAGTRQIVRSDLSGKCWVYGLSQIGLDLSDPYPEGFTLADTWGG